MVPAAGQPKQDLVLPFSSVWKTTTIPAAKVACTLETSAGEATVRTAGAASTKTPSTKPIDEEEDEEGDEASSG